MLFEATHPSGIVVKIVGIAKGDHGRLCEEHDVCGTVVKADTLLRLRKEQILVDGQEETAIACYWVTDGIDHCRIGFLKRRVSDTAEEKMHHQNHGCALGTIVSALYDIKKNCIATESLAEIGRKRKAQEDAGYPLNKKYGLPIPK